MVNILSNIRARIESALVFRARAEVRRKLLLMSDRSLEDIGVSRELLELGNSAWPWKLPAEQTAASLPHASDYSRAIRGIRAGAEPELNALDKRRPGIDYPNDFHPA